MATLAIAFARPALAAGDGSITIKQQTSDNKPITGGEVAVYQVGSVNDDGTYKYLAPFDKMGDDLNERVESATGDDKAARDYVKELKGIADGTDPVDTRSVGSEGTATIPRLQNGVYLVVQTKAPDGYGAFESFLITVPYKGENAVEIDPKLSPSSTPKPNPAPNPGPTSGGTTTPSDTTTPASDVTPTEPGGTLPQTGQLWWPVAVLAAAGIALFLVGKHANGKRA